MSKAADLRIIIFLSLVASVYVLAFATLIRLLLNKLGYIQLTNSKWGRYLRRISLIAAFLGIICFIYGFVEPYLLNVSYVKLTTKKFSNGSKPLKIAHFSDLHSDPTPRLENKLISRIEIEKPDIIVFTGDTINSTEALEVARDFFSKLSKIAPTYVVKGNWDSWFWYNLNLFGETGVKELRSISEKLTINNNSFWITGVAVGQANQVSKLIEKIPNEDFSILLYHYPDEIEDLAGKIDLYCAGHTHGGQIAMPFYGALITYSKFDKKYESGLYKVKDTWLYVNRGIGMEGGNTPRVRFCSRPELTIIEIYPANS
ncbi:MAG: metallophosphoesterase family protein [Acidobacteria bacterium]|nr:metallophosphoesterase family protein [Acidobacteriota bacterium]